MTPAKRHQRILAAARRSGKVMAEALAQELDVTVQTIRRDLRHLCDAGLLERTHGGAVLPLGAHNIGYAERRSVQRDAKALIGRQAAALIPDGASVFLNIGTTTEAVARALRDHRDLMVVTNNLNVANILSDVAGAEVIVTGGRLRRTDGGLVGDLAALAIARFEVDIAVLGASAISAQGFLLDFDPEEVRVSQAIMAAARRRIVVADASKFGRRAPVRIAKLTDAEDLVTDRIPSEALAGALMDAGMRLHLAR